MEKKFYIFNLEHDRLILWDQKEFASEVEANQEIVKILSNYKEVVNLIVLSFWTNYR